MNETFVDVITRLESILLEKATNGVSCTDHSHSFADSLTWAIAKNGISRQTKESVRANDMCSLSVYAPTGGGGRKAD
jgi:hypothetical protein